MAARRSQPAHSEPQPRHERSGCVAIPHEVVQFAVRYAVASGGEDIENRSADEIGDIATRLAASVLEMQVTPGAVIDSRARSPLGRYLLEVMRDEVMSRWRPHGLSETQLPGLLLAMERAREAIANPAAHALVSQLGSPAALELLAEVAHDMHSPLGSILVLVETLQREESGPLTDVQRHQIGLIYTAALGLSSVGSDIIDLNRSERLLEPRPIPFSVMSLLESVRDIVRPIAEVKRLEVRLKTPLGDERLGHPVALRRVLLNLTTNALKFTEHGFVEISTHEVRPGWMEFTVRDSGRGIDPAMISTLFDSVRKARHDQPGGKLFSTTGLGLAICRKLAEGMGSELRVETEVGRGTKFFFELNLPVFPSWREPGRNSDPNRRRHETPAA